MNPNTKRFHASNRERWRLVELLTQENVGGLVMVSEAASKFEHIAWNQWWGKKNKS